MKNKLLITTVSMIGLMAATSAQAGEMHHDDHGWYLRGNVGYGAHSDAELSGDMTSAFHGNGLQSEGNGAFSLGLGYDFGNNWRLELDGDTLWTDLGSISQTPNSSAKLRTSTLMLNALYDFDEFGNWEPYVGAGVGIIRAKGDLVAHDFLSAQNILGVNPACAGTRLAGQGESCAIHDKDTGLGFQLLAGLGYDITDKLTWDTHYSYMDAISDFDFTGVRTNGITGGTSAIAATLDDVAAHTLMTGFRYSFGGKSKPKMKETPPPPPAPVADYKCWDGSMVFNAGQCPAEPKPEPTVRCWDGSMVFDNGECPAQPATITCWDGTLVYDRASCPVQEVVQRETYTCWDGTLVYDRASCPVQQTVVRTANLNVCGASPVAIFNVPVNSTPKQMPRLGTLPEFGDSHGLTPTQFYEKLNSRYSANAGDRAYLNYLFRSMGYTNGWKDAQPYMFSEEVLPVGTRGLLGLGEQHHYNYSILPTNDRDRQAFRIQSANGSVVHFMKTCGNYMYACE